VLQMPVASDFNVFFQIVPPLTTRYLRLCDRSRFPWPHFFILKRLKSIAVSCSTTTVELEQIRTDGPRRGAV
jgi:hypothetical protein